MTCYIVTANGVAFAVFADTFEQATRTACVHLAFLTGCRVVESVREIA